MDKLRKGVGHFEQEYATLTAGLRQQLDAANGNAVIWGSGSKGVSFISNLGLQDEIKAAVDINPHKWGKFMVGSDHPIISPDQLKAIDPDLVVAMNPIYLEEIGAQLRELGIDTELTAL